MQITISNKIYIQGAPAKMIADMRKVLTLPNPVYMTLLRRVKYGSQSARCLYAVKKDFKYFEYDKTMDLFVCGRGLENRIKKYCSASNIQYKLKKDLVSTSLKKPISFNGKLRGYQEGVVAEILSCCKNGILRLDTAWGKTILSGLLIKELNKTALIIVPRNIILDQFIDTFKELFNYDVGIIQGKKFDIKDITVASISTLGKRDLSKIKDKFSIILEDECHMGVSDKRIELLQQFNPKYLFGLTGTCERDDGKTEAINFLFGDVLIDKKLPISKPIVYKIKTGSLVQPNIDYAEMILELIEDEKRNNIIKNLIEKETFKGRKVICLTKRVAHNSIIKELINKNIRCVALDSTVKNKEKIFTELRNGKGFDVVLGTFSLLSTGINLEILSTLIIAGDLRSKVLTTQSSGRCLRAMLNKPDVKIYDLVDENNGILLSQWRSRRQVYLKNNWEIIDSI